MKIFNNLDRFLNEKQLRINIRDNQVNIVNYDEIMDFSLRQVIVCAGNRKIIVTGNNLVISKLMDNEVLINGIIDNISFLNLT